MDDTYLIQAFSMYFLSLWKTYLGPLIAAGSGFSYAEMLAFNLGAALSSTLSMLFLTDLWMKKRRTKKRGFNKHLRRTLRIWKRYGRVGALALAPILIGIPTYAVLARRFKESKRRIVIELSCVITLWCTLIFIAGQQGLLIAEAWI